MFERVLEHWPIVFVGSAVLIAWAFAKLVLGNQRLPYQKRSSLMTKPELAFYRALVQAVDGRWCVHAMVRMADLLEVQPDISKPQSWRNRIQSQRIDFLLCDLGTMEAKLAVELDDPAGNEPSRPARNRFVGHALSDAGLRLLRSGSSAVLRRPPVAQGDRGTPVIRSRRHPPLSALRSPLSGLSCPPPQDLPHSKAERPVISRTCAEDSPWLFISVWAGPRRK